MINLNCGGRSWRYYVVDNIFKYDLYKYGEYALRVKKNCLDERTYYIIYYPLLEGKKISIDHWTPIDTKLDDDVNTNNIIDQYVVPKKYMESAFDIVVETLYNSFFITEKTIRAINSIKPFIVFSSVNFHYKLCQYGFKLYDDIINYDFDSIESTTDRFNAQILELKKIADKYTPEEIYYLTNEKAFFNYNKLIEYRNKKTPHYIPNEIWNFLNEKIYEPSFEFFSEQKKYNYGRV